MPYSFISRTQFVRAFYSMSLNVARVAPCQCTRSFLFWLWLCVCECESGLPSCSFHTDRHTKMHCNSSRTAVELPFRRCYRFQNPFNHQVFTGGWHDDHTNPKTVNRMILHHMCPDRRTERWSGAISSYQFQWSFVLIPDSDKWYLIGCDDSISNKI